MKCAVTFVMPAYNAAEFIAEAVGSLQGQTVADWKLIVVDDGSTDGTYAIACGLAAEDGRISVLRMPRPSGSAYMPRKHAILNATTEYVAPMDADDWVGPDYLAKLLDVAERTDAGIVYPTMWRSKGMGVDEPRRLVPECDDFYDKVFDGRDLVRHTLDGWHIGAGGGVIRKSAYEKAFENIRCGRIHTYSDELLTRYLLLGARRVAFSDAEYYYRANPGSVTQQSNPARLHNLINNVDLIGFCRSEYGEDSLEYMLAQRQNFHGIFDALRLLRRAGIEDRGEVMKMVRDSCRAVDRNVVRGNVSPRYYALSRLPLPLMDIFLSMYDKVAGKK